MNELIITRKFCENQKNKMREGEKDRVIIK